MAGLIIPQDAQHALDGVDSAQQLLVADIGRRLNPDRVGGGERRHDSDPLFAQQVRTHDEAEKTLLTEHPQQRRSRLQLRNQLHTDHQSAAANIQQLSGVAALQRPQAFKEECALLLTESKKLIVFEEVEGPEGNGAREIIVGERRCV